MSTDATAESDFRWDVFLSYSHSDEEVVRDIANRLKSDGVNVWFDRWVIQAGDHIPSKIEEGLEHSRVLVLCLSQAALAGDWPQLESHTFRFKDPLNHERRFIPLRLDDTPINGSLAQFLYINWRPKQREQEYSKLLARIQEDSTMELPSMAENSSQIDVSIVNALLKTASQECFRIRYLDNCELDLNAVRSNDVLVAFVHGIGLDCHDFELAMSGQFRSIAPTMPGFHSNDSPRYLRFDQHCDVLRDFLAEVMSRDGGVDCLVLVGFSVGADLVLEIVHKAIQTKERWVKNLKLGIVLLDPNRSSETCFLTSKLASLDINAPWETVEPIIETQSIKVSISTEELQELSRVELQRRFNLTMSINQYFVKVFKKLRQPEQLAPLKRLAEDVIRRFSCESDAAFIGRINNLGGVTIHCVLSDDAANRAFMETHQDDHRFELRSNQHHFDLIENVENLLADVGNLVRDIR